MGSIVKGEKRALGNKGGGRKSKAEEFEKFREQITSEQLILLANRIVGKKLKALDEMDINELTQGAVKDLAIPISLKGITDKVDHTGNITIEIVRFNKDENKPAI